MVIILFSFGNLWILIFDVIFMNEGNGYNYYMGVFIVLRIGFYVFMWIIWVGYFYLNIQFIVNGLIYGWMYLLVDNYYGYIDISLIMVVVCVMVGSFVYVRIGFISISGIIYSGNEGYFIFFGWIID